MKRAILALTAASGLVACSTPPTVVGPPEISSRAAQSPAAAAVAAEGSGDYRVTSFRMEVPATLRVSESASFYPMFTDIVWRGDPIGDRRAQVGAIFDAAAARAIAADQGTREVAAVGLLERFHGVTERTRSTVGGIYNIRFWLSYVDAATGQPLGEPELVVANLGAPGGRAAVALDAAGQTEKVRVTDHLAAALAAEFAEPRPL